MAMNSGGGSNSGGWRGGGWRGGGWRGSRDSHRGIVRDDSWQRTVKRPKPERWLSGGGGDAKRKSIDQEQAEPRNEMSHPPMAEIAAPKKPIERLRSANLSKQFTTTATTNRDQDSQRPVQRPSRSTPSPSRDVPAREGDVDIAGNPKPQPEKQSPKQLPKQPPPEQPLPEQSPPSQQQQPEQFIQQYDEHGYKIGPPAPLDESAELSLERNRDCRMMLRALREGWFPIDSDTTQELKKSAEYIMKHAKSFRTRLMANKVIQQMNASNAKIVELQLKVEQAELHEELALKEVESKAAVANQKNQTQLQQPQLHLHQHRYQNDHQNQQSIADTAREIEIVRPVERLIQSDSAYLEFLRQQAVKNDGGYPTTFEAITAHGDAGPVCEGSQPGPVEDGATPSVSGCEDNDSLDPWQC